LIALRVGVFFI
jgi:hypothetical protein